MKERQIQFRQAKLAPGLQSGLNMKQQNIFPVLYIYVLGIADCT